MNRPAKILLVAALVGVVGMAFRVSWAALRDVARAVGADDTGALLYAGVVDGLMALALVATLVLTEPASRLFALRVLAAYTVASLALNYVHGLVPALHHPDGRVELAAWAPAHWGLVLLATSLPVGSIYFGSDLVAKVLHHRAGAMPEPVAEPVLVPAEPATEPPAVQTVPALVQPAPAVPVLGPWTPVAELAPGSGGTSTGTSPDLHTSAIPVPPEPGAEPAEPDPGSAGTTTGSGGTDTRPWFSEDSVFGRRVEEVRDWLRDEPELTGTMIGNRLGTSDAYGRRVRRAALRTARYTSAA